MLDSDRAVEGRIARENRTAPRDGDPLDHAPARGSDPDSLMRPAGAVDELDHQAFLTAQRFGAQEHDILRPVGECKHRPSERLARLRVLLERHVDTGFVPGTVAVLARHGEVRIEATGTLAFEGAGSATAMAGDTVVRLGSMSKPIVAACAMTLVEDCTLRLDDPVDDLLPELADMTVLADPAGPLDVTVAADRPITLRDLLTYTLGTGMVPAEPGTVPIADALNTLADPLQPLSYPPPDE